MKENLLLRVVGYAFSLLTLLSCATEPTQRESFSSEGYTQTVLYPRRTDAPIILTLPIKESGSLRGATDAQACVSYLFTAGGAAVIRGGMDVQPFAAVIPRLYEMPEK